MKNTISSFILSVADANEEFFEYDAEEFLVFLTLLITEGRTPEYSVKGRTEGLHCPPAQSAMPPLHKHECSDKLPQVSNHNARPMYVLSVCSSQVGYFQTSSTPQSFIKLSGGGHFPGPICFSPKFQGQVLTFSNER